MDNQWRATVCTPLMFWRTALLVAAITAPGCAVQSAVSSRLTGEWSSIACTGRTLLRGSEISCDNMPGNPGTVLKVTTKGT